MKKFYVLTALCLLCATSMRAAIQSGQFEEYNAQWEFNDATGVLTISVIDDDPENEDFGGFGIIPDFEGDFADEDNPIIPTPWWSFKDDIESIVIEEGIQRVGMCAFAMCFYTEHLTLPVNMAQIGRSAFFRCAGLTELTFPMITFQRSNGDYYAMEIEEYAFAGCMGIQSITSYQITPPEVQGYQVFAGMNVANIPVYVPAESFEDYMDDSDWSEFDLRAMASPADELCEVMSTGFDFEFVHSQLIPAMEGEGATLMFLFLYDQETWYEEVNGDDWNLITPTDGNALRIAFVASNPSDLRGSYSDTNERLGLEGFTALVVRDDGDVDEFSCVGGEIIIAANEDNSAYDLVYTLTIDANGSTETISGTVAGICSDEIDIPEEGGEGGEGGEGDEAIDNVQGGKVQGTKVLRDGQLLINMNGKMYNAQGAEIK